MVSLIIFLAIAVALGLWIMKASGPIFDFLYEKYAPKFHDNEQHTVIHTYKDDGLRAVCPNGIKVESEVIEIESYMCTTCVFFIGGANGKGIRCGYGKFTKEEKKIREHIKLIKLKEPS